ncbi:MAG: AIPR family protein [Pseudomonadota bacterium]|nr:AIPR family protein [Pseudomonadota bacterium]
MESWEAALSGRSELEQYGENKLLLFALDLHQEIDDIDLIANDVLTDGPNDKKCDLVYVNRETGKVIIAQGYWAKSMTKKQAPANKASDLNTAATWLLSLHTEIPDILKSVAEQLHAALLDQEVSSIEFWYVHNLDESENVEAELDRVSQTAESLIKRYFPDSQVDLITASEVGRNTLDTWYRGTQAPILVTDSYNFETKGGFKTKGINWEAYSTSIPAAWLQEIYSEHGKNLFSANVRDYLGSRQTDKNINHNIKETARNHPEMFWVYNNGITALVNDFEYTSEDDLGVLKISGIAIVNGAQTTGSIGAAGDADLKNAYIPARFVKCSDANTVQEIIRFNNSQNKIEASDFRSNDQIQTRLRREFDTIPGIVYTGGRRSAESFARRSRGQIPSYSAAQALMAFHGDPGTAYNQRSNIWKSDTLYSKIFNTETTAEHIVFAYSLLKAVDEFKLNLRNIGEDNRTDTQSRQWNVLGQRGATFLVSSAIASSMETILKKPVPNRFQIKFKSISTIEAAIEAWSDVLLAIMPLVNKLSRALESGNLKNKDVVKSSIDDFVDMLEAVRHPNAQIFDNFADLINS